MKPDKPTQIHLPRLFKPDHQHTCQKCGRRWSCRNYSRKDCLAKGVFHAAKVNREGPYCLVCLRREMHRRGFKGPSKRFP